MDGRVVFGRFGFGLSDFICYLLDVNNNFLVCRLVGWNPLLLLLLLLLFSSLCLYLAIVVLIFIELFSKSSYNRK